MNVSTKGRYALRMMLDLAEHQGDGIVTLKDVAARQDISHKYLEQIVSILNRANLLQTIRGAQGGCRLAKPADKCTVGEILRITEGEMILSGSAEPQSQKTKRQRVDMTVDVWRGLAKAINNYLDNITLQDILDKDTQQRISDYSI
ncbi:MAG: Rrf2 family transcriptional regulator [Planctomycetaceae bacterium]|jgi:Rrf2 family protein|nr:Rrf2 family transcriptional regulator [Planctomycetaceae bacterium]